MRRRIRNAVAIVLVAAGIGQTTAAPGDWQDYISFTLSERLRGEFVDWFRPPEGTAAPGAERYDFFASQLRVGLRATFPHAQLVVEVQDTRIAGLPDDASLPSPAGNLGPGAIYFAHTRDTDQGTVFLKEGHLTLRHSEFAASIGRMEYSDGLETIPADPTLAWLKRWRIAERLVGPFGYTHVQRSFDAVRAVYDRTDFNLTALAAHPTHGGFEVSANRELDDVSLAGLTLTLKQVPVLPPSDLRLFYLYYEDERDKPVKVDNRPLPARAADRDLIAIHTFGGHAITAIEAGPGIVDGLAWTALQTGEWGGLDHGAFAYAVEAGYQWPRWPGDPWLRVGYNRSSGDDQPGDAEHDTFFQVLPTSRPYAQLPFFNLMNNEDLFAQLILKPHPRVTVRADYHWLRLAEAGDLWYSGGGATNKDIFGYSGIPSGGFSELAHLLDVGITVRLHERLTAYAYYGHAFGRDVVKNTFAGEDADYGYLELTFRY